MSEDNLYKYRVGNSWFTFDKSVLAPEDLRVFELANWRDKLKIITIYKDLKAADDNDVIILRTKTEVADKDVRRRQYTEQKAALENEIGKINEWYDKAIASAVSDVNKQAINNSYEEKLRTINNKLSSLDTSYADVIMVKRIDALDAKKSNRLILKNVKEILEGADKTLNELKTTLKEGDYKIIESIFKDTLQAETKGQLSDNIDTIINTINTIKENTNTPNAEDKLKSLQQLVDELKNTLSASNDYIDFIMNYLMPEEFKTKPFITKISVVSSLMDEAGVKNEDIETIWNYPEAIKIIQKLGTNKFKYITVYGNLIRLYNVLKNNEDGDTNTQFTLKADKRSYKPMSLFMNKFEPEINLIDKTVYKVKHGTKKDDYENLGNYLLCDNKSNKDTYKYIQAIVGNRKEYKAPSNNEVETTGGLFSFSNGGFLGLKTNKQAKRALEAQRQQDFDFINERIDKILSQQDKILEKLEQVLSSQSQPSTRTEQEASYSKPVIESRPKMAYFQDIREQPKLKHVEPTPQAPELTELQKTFNKRREQMGYTDDDDTITEDEVWADGLGAARPGGLALPNFGLRGGLLEELVEDLKRYGLALSLAPDEKAYFLNVYEKGKTKHRKPKAKGAAGIEEADTLVKSVNQDTEYKDLKKLYEQLY